jgi:hypothetical protein
MHILPLLYATAEHRLSISQNYASYKIGPRLQTRRGYQYPEEVHHCVPSSLPVSIGGKEQRAGWPIRRDSGVNEVSGLTLRTVWGPALRL